MKKYLAELHTKSDHHKKRFAFAVSGVVTLFIFSMWTLANFGPGGTLAQNELKQEPSTKEVGPLESLKTGIANSLEGIKEVFEGLSESLNQAAGLPGGLNNYGQ